jgi:hypothetical protein
MVGNKHRIIFKSKSISIEYQIRILELLLDEDLKITILRAANRREEAEIFCRQEIASIILSSVNQCSVRICCIKTDSCSISRTEISIINLFDEQHRVWSGCLCDSTSLNTDCENCVLQYFNNSGIIHGYSPLNNRVGSLSEFVIGLRLEVVCPILNSIFTFRVFKSPPYKICANKISFNLIIFPT